MAGSSGRRRKYERLIRGEVKIMEENERGEPDARKENDFLREQGWVNLGFQVGQ